MTQGVVQTERERLEQAVTRVFHMCNTHCPGNLAPLMTPDVELIGEREGRGQEEIHQYLVWLWEAYPEMVYRLENVLVDGNAAAAEVTYVNGPNGSGSNCVIFHFRDGLVRRIRVY